jgi:ribosomal protein S17E
MTKLKKFFIKRAVKNKIEGFVKKVTREFEREVREIRKIGARVPIRVTTK